MSDPVRNPKDQFSHIVAHIKEHGGLVVECRTSNREVQGLNPTGLPCFILEQDTLDNILVNTLEVLAPSSLHD